MGSEQPVRAEALTQLRRSWWFSNLKAHRPLVDLRTYAEFDLDAQPSVHDADESLSWLVGRTTPIQWGIDESDAEPQRRLTTSGLASLVPDFGLVPAALRVLAARPDLQRSIRSATACYLDLGDRLVATSAPGGRLLHLLSDQQWVRHWLVYFDEAGAESVVTTAEPVGFVLPEEDGWGAPLPDVIPLDGSFDLQICADTAAEFLFRFWVENEIFFLGPAADQADGVLARYAAALRSANGS